MIDAQTNRILIVENQYFPIINYIKILFENTHIIFYSFEAYQKMSFRNRCIVAGSNGLINLSVPVENGRNQKVPFKDIRISYKDGWQKQQWVTLLSCYNKSAFFEFYRDGLEKLFTGKIEFLFDLDLEILQWLKGVLQFTAEIVVLDDPAFLEQRAEITDYRNRWLPKNYDQPALNTFAQRYYQVFEERIGFKQNLSILDLLFNEGPNARNLLMP